MIGIAKQRALWSGRRGMLELDLLLLPFIEKEFDKLTLKEKKLLEELLLTPDVFLFDWLVSNLPSDRVEFAPLLTKIKAYV